MSNDYDALIVGAGAAGLAALAGIFELPLSHLESLLVSSHAHDWSADDFARGAYSYVPAGALDARGRSDAGIALDPAALNSGKFAGSKMTRTL